MQMYNLPVVNRFGSGCLALSWKDKWARQAKAEATVSDHNEISKQHSWNNESL